MNFKQNKGKFIKHAIPFIQMQQKVQCNLFALQDIVCYVI